MSATGSWMKEKPEGKPEISEGSGVGLLESPGLQKNKSDVRLILVAVAD